MFPSGCRRGAGSREFGFPVYCTKAGLDLAIVNTEKLERFASIPAQERELAETSVSHPPKDVPAEIRMPGCCEMFPPTGAAEQGTTRSGIALHRSHCRTLPHDEEEGKSSRGRRALEERLANYIIEGTRDGLVEDLEKKRGEGAAPLDT